MGLFVVVVVVASTMVFDFP